NLEPGIEKISESGSTSEIENISIEFKNVWFRYQKDLPWIIKDVSFKISPGERIAMVGENGVGKSTLIKLLARFYEPGKGEVLVNGKNVSSLNLLQWREKLAVLFQDFEGYPFSVRESIGYGDVKRMGSLKEIKKVARDTGIDDFIEGLSLKYDTPINPRFEKGIHLSNGQWQRIAISRVLFRKNAKVMILDEPTSNVDPEAEEMIFKKLVRLTKDKILIFVTQRFSTTRIADRIFVVHGGRVVEDGTHKELMERNEKYARLYNLQAKAYLSS
ncbi:ABC transporter ATP-binding protein/permease, partial [Patescibacteria group bacterium]|nr:ABC transporter ATP-binding protein/permease [Patescibacteria group bacterium]